ncbi:MAG: type III pantothenate kinase [Eggerthellaceae bacterium]|nr:type III pantothenate kinase [Eggerthellaceae bacterium]
MLLAIDVGNTQTVLGVYDGKDLKHMWRIATNKKETADELRLKARPLLESENLAIDDLEGSVLASVVPALTTGWVAALEHLVGKAPLICNAEAAGDLFMTTYDNPAEIGADRIADAVAARVIYGAPVVVVDFGTATNMEVIDNDGCFVGGVIAPGMETSAAALFAHATKLAATELVDPHTAIGRSTTEAIQAGIVYGEAARVDGIVRRIFAQLGYEAPVVATGGLATRVAEFSETITDTNSELTLEGLRMVYEANKDES